MVKKHIFDFFAKTVSELSHECGVVPLEVRGKMLEGSGVLRG